MRPPLALVIAVGLGTAGCPSTRASKQQTTAAPSAIEAAPPAKTAPAKTAPASKPLKPPYKCVFPNAEDYANTTYTCNGTALGRGTAGFERLLALLDAAPVGSHLRLSFPVRGHLGSCDCMGAPWEEACTKSTLKPRFRALAKRKRLVLTLPYDL